MCVLDVIKNISAIVFNLMSRTNETRHIKWHEHVSLNIDYMQASKIIKNVGIKIKADVNVKN